MNLPVFCSALFRLSAAGSRVYLLLVSMLLLFGCQQRDDAVAVPQTISDRILEDDQFGLFRVAVVRASMGDELKGGNLTLFAPNNTAFQASGLATPEAIQALPAGYVRSLVQYHVLYGQVPVSAIPSGNNSVQMANGGIAYVNKTSDQAITINNAKLTQTNLTEANGYIHVIDRVLLPPTGTLQATIQGNAGLSLLTAAIGRVSATTPALSAALSSTAASGSLATVFAPNDAAFQAAGYGSVSAINAANLQTLTNLLLYHVLPNAVFSSQFQTGSVNTLLSNNRLSITAASSTSPLTIKGNKNSTAAFIKQADIPASNGVVHIIDQVLLP